MLHNIAKMQQITTITEFSPGLYVTEGHTQLWKPFGSSDAKGLDMNWC